MGNITQNVRQILGELPPGVQLVAVAKGRSLAEIQEAIAAGAPIIGENYLQEAVAVQPAAGSRVQWHFIGHLQRNKVRQAAGIFDMIETIDSLELAMELDKRSRQLARVMPVLVEINSAREPNKSGVLPEAAMTLIERLEGLPGIRVQGLMTMGPAGSDAETIRPYFRLTRRLFEDIKVRNLPNVEMKYLSMGMTESYRVAIEEGSNLVRIGRGIFGERLA